MAILHDILTHVSDQDWIYADPHSICSGAKPIEYKWNEEN